MELQLIKDFLDARHEVKRIDELMPTLPKGMTPRHMRIIDIIYQRSQRAEGVKVSDVSKTLQVTKPSITKLINELEQLGVVQKNPDAQDKRVIWLQLTDLGLSYHNFYVQQYHNWLAIQLEGVKPEHLQITAQTIQQVSRILRTAEMNLDNTLDNDVLDRTGGDTLA